MEKTIKIKRKSPVKKEAAKARIGLLNKSPASITETR